MFMMILTDIKQLGNIIQKVRKNQQITQQQLAATCGVGIRFIRELEKGKESCHISKALLVIRMLGISIEVHGNDLL
jgi:y4mF family transcriptional regulator